MPLGRPVVPEENTTHRGWSNGTGVQASCSAQVAASSQGTTSEGYTRESQGRPTWSTSNVALNVVSAPASSRTASRRSWVVPLKK